MRAPASFLPLVLALLGWNGAAGAHTPSARECREAGEFIKNAALGRDNGLSRRAYMEQLLSDLELIRAVPVEMRWFVQDDEDAVLLVSAAQAVFDEPRSPAEHQGAFLNQCRARGRQNPQTEGTSP
jgi:hypothetical protein